MELTDLIALTVPGSADPAVAIAACRAGARGGIDTELLGDRSAVREAVAKLAKFAPGRFGVKLGHDAADLASHLLADGGPRPGWVILAGGEPDDLVGQFRAAGVEVLVEAVSLAEAVRAEQLGADGVILKGNEAGGRVGADSAFILVQKWYRHVGETGKSVPFWVHGGVGPNTAAACRAAGARGVVVDSQLLLTRESPVSDELRKRILGSDGSETTILGERFGEPVRFYSRADSPAAAELASVDERLAEADYPEAGKLTEWRKAVRDRVAADPAVGLWPVGQDFALGATLATKAVTVAGVLQVIAERANRQFELAGKLKPLAEGGPLAVSNGTQFPILQGPMTRVSDTAAFADAVADGGGLPFLALALFRKAEADKLLAETKAKVGNKPWGVGILGFVSPEIRAEQLEVVRKYKPPFAIIAGGRPDQAKELEDQGIATYLHVPSPGLLRMFLKDGARRFIFEGRECGGHVGPRSSFALWEAMAEVLAEYATGTKGAEVHAVFAGGVHDELSAAMVASLAAGLAEKGVKVGVLLGTAYLFTEEAVAAGAITAKFQQEALECGDTVLLETGPGHAIRVIPTPYADDFEAEKRRLKADGKSPMEVGTALERMNLGRLRVASKGVDRSAAGANGSHLKEVSGDEQRRRGMYMIGQVAALWDGVVTISQLHDAVSNGSSEHLVSVSPSLRVSVTEHEAPPPCDVAVIGLACFYPKAGSLWQYWENILAKKSAVTEIPPSHWDWRLYYDADPRAKDKSVSKWGGFMDDITFDPLTFGITPKSIPNIEPLQLLLLEGVRQAMTDAGYADREFARERTAAILGIGGGGMPLSVSYGFRACMPLMDTIPGVTSKSSEVIAKGTGILPEWTEDSFPGILLNVAAGRVANRFNLGGPNMAIDAACGSSLAAVYAGIKELNEKTSDLAIVMGADTVQTPYAYVAFSKTHALSAKGRCRPFDAEADGIALAEGIGVAVLKRLEDAERDGDRIYSVIRGMGASSDGRDKGLTAPRAEGQLRSLQRAYAQARLSPARVGLVEAHGTGTVVGDRTEALALGQMYREAGGQAQSCALGSVKSMIGHSKCAAGLAGLIKAAFALHYKVLPPTLAETPNPKANLDGGPLFLNTEARPWVHGGDKPRAAGVSAFGFGGTNFHAVLEEYDGDYLNRRESGVRTWPSELFVWRRADKAALTSAITKVRDALAAGASPTPANLAASVWQSSRSGTGQPTLAVVAGTLDELRDKLDAALGLLAKPGDTHTDPRGIYFAEKSGDPGKVAFLFPGQGSQYPDMLAQTAMAFPEVREVIDAADRTLSDRLDRPLGKLIYPPSPFTPEQEADNRTNLQRTEVAQPALGAVSLGMARLLESLGVEADMFAGHSYGEYAALAAAGALSDADLVTLSHRRGEVIRDAAASAAGGMAAVDATPDAIAPILKGVKDVWPANENSPSQTVLAGTDEGLSLALEKLKAAGVRAQRIPVACGFHSPLIAGAKPPLAAALAEVTFATPRKPVFSNTTTAPHADNPDAIRTQLADHLVSPVKFAAEIEAMYAAGARVFIEVGPQAVLTGLAGQTLGDKPHLAIASDQKARPGLTQLAHLLGQLLAHGVPADLDRLYQGRGVTPFDVAKLSADTGKVKHTPTTWVVNGVRSRPINGPEPRLLGQPLSAEEASRAAEPAVASPAPVTEKPQAAPAGPAARPAASVPTPSRPPSTAPVVPRATMHPTPAPVPSANGVHHHQASGAEQVVLRFQDVMAKFLDTQRSVMLGYLGAADTHPPAPSANGHAAVNGYANGYHTPLIPPAVANRLASPPATAPGSLARRERETRPRPGRVSIGSGPGTHANTRSGCGSREAGRRAARPGNPARPAAQPRLGTYRLPRRRPEYRPRPRSRPRRRLDQAGRDSRQPGRDAGSRGRRGRAEPGNGKAVRDQDPPWHRRLRPRSGERSE